MSKKQQNPKGPWINRFISKILTFVLAVLIFWLPNFLVDDIRKTRGPDYSVIEKEFVDAALVERKDALHQETEGLQQQIADRHEEQRLIGEGSRNFQSTINQLLETKRLSIEKDVAPAENEKDVLSASLEAFLESQKNYQELNQQIAGLAAQKRKLEQEKREAEAELVQQHEPAREAYRVQNEKHRLRLAALQLAVLVPLLVVGGFLVVKRRSSIYFPLYFAFAAATLLKVALVIHEYFPQRYFKYILIGVLLIVVGRVLIHFIRMAAFPKADWLLKQYREAYERFLCPVCEYPIRTGPRMK